MDNEIEKMFDKQQKMKKMNEDSLQNRINELNNKPVLRDYLFK